MSHVRLTARSGGNDSHFGGAIHSQCIRENNSKNKKAKKQKKKQGRV